MSFILYAIKTIVAVGVLILLLFFLQMKAARLPKGLKKTIVFFAVVALVLMVAWSPSKDAELRFDTPEEAIHYVNENAVYVKTCRGDNVAFAIAPGYQKGTVTCSEMVRRDERGWMASGQGNNPETKYIWFENCLIIWSKFEHCDEWVLEVSERRLSPRKSISEIQDAQNSEFDVLLDTNDEPFYYIAFVKQSDPDYFVTINGTDVSINVLDDSLPEQQFFIDITL